MLIDPQGLFYGDRISACSDEAQLHFPRLMAASNGYGRIELSISKLHSTVYLNFKVKPTRQQIQGWIREYHDNFLLFIYRAENGATWGQWSVSKGKLPKYKTADDNRSPAPDSNAFLAFQRSYVEQKRQKYEAGNDYLDISGDFRNSHEISEKTAEFQKSSQDSGKVLKSSEDFGRFSQGEVVVVGEVVGGGEVEVEVEKPLKLSATDVQREVLMRTGLSGQNLSRNLSDVATAELRRGWDGFELIERMAEALNEHEQARLAGRLTQYAPKPEGFIGDGMWRDPALWRWKDGHGPPKPKSTHDPLAEQRREREEALREKQRLEGNGSEPVQPAR